MPSPPVPRRVMVQAGIIYGLFILATLSYQVFLHTPQPAAAGMNRTARAKAGVVDLTEFTMGLNRQIVESLGLHRRPPGTAGIPTRHSWQLVSRHTGGVEWRWVEGRHEYDLSGTIGTRESVPDNLETISLAVKKRWAESGGDEVYEEWSVEGNRQILQLKLQMKLGDGEAPVAPLSALVLRRLLPPAGKTQGAGPAGMGEVSSSAPGGGNPVQNGVIPPNNTGNPARNVPIVPGGPTIAPGEKRPGSGRVRICIVLDDAGDAPPDVASLFWQLPLRPGPLTIAVLPFGPYSREQAEKARALGHEVILHMPMEPFGSENPGPGAIFTHLSDTEITERVRQALEAIPEAVGLNNHMGSRATSDSRVMRAVMGEVRKQGLFFLDSMTIANSVGAGEARKMGIPSAVRHVFLDNVATEDAVTQQLNRLLQLARQQGVAVGIGHLNRPATAKALAAFLPELERQGVELIPISRVVK